MSVHTLYFPANFRPGTILVRRVICTASDDSFPSYSVHDRTRRKDLFKGSVLLRFRNAKSDDPTKHADYFDGRKRLMQTVIQGRFKRPVNMGDVYVGSLFAKPLAGAPPKTMTKIMDAVIRRIAPGLVLDLSSNLPKVIAILAGTAQTMSIDEPGKEPDITSKDIEENVGHILGQKLSTRHKRRKVLSIPSKASKFTFDTHNVYTFHTYDDGKFVIEWRMHYHLAALTVLSSYSNGLWNGKLALANLVCAYLSITANRTVQ